MDDSLDSLFDSFARQFDTPEKIAAAKAVIGERYQGMARIDFYAGPMPASPGEADQSKLLLSIHQAPEMLVREFNPASRLAEDPDALPC